MASTSSSNLYEMRFEWPHPEPTTVIVTGTFDQWSRSVHLKRSENGFVAEVPLPWGEKIKYKFIVDGRWLTQPGQPTETDPGGFVNNVHFTPPKPEPAVVEETNGHAAPASSPIVEELTKPVEAVPAVEEKEPTVEDESPAEQPAVVQRSPQRRVSIPIVPVNAAENSTITTPPPVVPDYVLPPSPRARSASPPEADRRKEPTSVAPALESDSQRRVPIPIVPVNAAEHSTISTTTSHTVYPDYVLPPSPRARSASPPVPVSTAVAPVAVPAPSETDLPKPQEADVSPEDVIAPAPDTPVEEQKQEAEAHIPVDCSDVHKDTDPLSEQHAVEQSNVIVAPDLEVSTPSTPPPAIKEPEDTSEKVKETKPTPSALPTPPPTPGPSKKESTFPRGSQSPPPTPTPVSPSSSRFNTAKSRKKRLSIFGKIKEIFHHDKEKVPK